jgi:hypothetical protein
MCNGRKEEEKEGELAKGNGVGKRGDEGIRRETQVKEKLTIRGEREGPEEEEIDR